MGRSRRHRNSGMGCCQITFIVVGLAVALAGTFILALWLDNDYCWFIRMVDLFKGTSTDCTPRAATDNTNSNTTTTAPPNTNKTTTTTKTTKKP